MIDIRSVLRSMMIADATVAGLFGTAGVYRYYPGVLPQGTTAASIVHNLISETVNYTMLGADDAEQMRVQLDAWAQTQDAAVALANAVKDLLSGFRGTVSYGSSSPQLQAEIQGIFVGNGRDDYDDTAKMHRRSRDYLVWYREA